METPSPATDQAIKKHIYRDLRPNPWTLHGKLAAAYAAGTLASLSVCTQFGLGLTPWSKAMQMLLMELGQLGCIVACGFFFRPISIDCIESDHSAPAVSRHLAPA